MDRKQKLIIIAFISTFIIAFFAIGIGILIWALIESAPPKCCEELIIPRNTSFIIQSRFGQVALEIVHMETNQLYGYLRKRSSGNFRLKNVDDDSMDTNG